MRLFGLVTIGLLAANSAFAAPLTLQSLGSSGGFYPVAPASAVVSDATGEFTEEFSGEPFGFEIDFAESGLVTVTWVSPGGLLALGTDTQTYTDINSTIDAIIGFNLISTSGVTGITQSDLSFTANSVTAALGNGTEWDPGGSFRAQIVFQPVPVPEPATLALLGLGLGGIAGARRRRAKLRLR